MARLKVITAWPRRRRLLALAVGGALLMLANVALRDQLSYTRPAQAMPGGGMMGSQTYRVGMVVTVLLVAPAVLVALSFSEQRMGRAMLEAGALALGLLLPLSGWALLRTDETVSGMIVTILAGTVSYILIRLVGLWLVRMFIRRLVPQTGPLCWTCGYNLTGNTSGVCPECGTAVPAPTGDRAMPAP